MKEIWKPIFRGLYEASSLGRVRRSRDQRVISHFIQRYAAVDCYTRQGRCHRLVHRLVAEAFLGPCPRGKEVNHKNGRRLDNRPENLEYVTAAENKAHAVANGFVSHGDRHPNSKLTAAKVRQIRRKFKPGMCAALAKEYGVHLATIDYIVRRKTWVRA